MKVPFLISFFIFTVQLLIGQPVANFNSDNTNGCGNTLITFYNNSTSYTSLELDFGDGYPVITDFSDSVAHVFKPGNGQAGVYNVKLTVIDGALSDVSNITITIHNKPTVVINADTTRGCSNLAVQLNSVGSLPGDGSSITSYKWTFGDGQGSFLDTPPIHNFPFKSSGLYNISLEVSDQYCSTLKINEGYIHVSNPPNITIAASPSNFACTSPYQALLYNSASNTISIKSYSWDFGDGAQGPGNNITHQYNAYGTYDVTLSLVDDNYCPNSKVSNAFISLENVQALFSVADTLCKGLETNFQSTSIGAVNYLWKFGDGDTSILENPTHTFLKGDDLTISLTIDNGNICSDTKSYNVHIQDLDAGFVMDTSWACTFLSPVNVIFTDTSSNQVTNWLWKFEDGSATSNIQNPTYAFNKQSDVTLIVESYFGCIDSIIRTFAKIIPDMSIQIDTSKGCIPLSVIFQDSTKAISTIKNRVWNFGDGNSFSSATVDTAFNVFMTADSFKTVLTVTDSICGDFNDTIVIAAGDLATVNFYFNNPSCASDTILFTDSSTAAGIITEWFWNFTDSIEPIETQNSLFHFYIDTVNKIENGLCYWEPFFQYTPPQSKYVKLTVGYNGCYTTDSSLLTLNGPIVVIDSIIHDCSSPLDYRVAFDTIMQATKVELLFTETQGGSNVSYTKYYQALVSLKDTIDVSLPTGEYNLNVIAYDTISGCQHSVFYDSWTSLGNCMSTPTKEKITVCASNPLSPAFTFSPTTVCSYDNVTFDASSSVNATSYQWFIREVGDTILHSLSSTIDSVSYLPPSLAGNYDVVLVTMACDLCTDTLEQNGLVSYLPTANYTLSNDSICAPDSVKFSILQTFSDISITNFFWSFGDDSTQSRTDTLAVSHYYDKQATIYPKLTLTDSYGCVSKDSVPLLISKANPIFNISPLKICPGGQVAFYVSDFNQDYYVWDYDDGSALDTIMFPPPPILPRTYTSPDTFNIVLTSSVNGCDSSYTQAFEVIQLPDLGFQADVTNIPCWSDGGTVIFTDTTHSNNILYRKWNFGPYTTNYLSDLDASYPYNGPGNFTISLSILTKSPANCIANLNKPGYITVGGSKASFNPPTIPICKNTGILFYPEVSTYQNGPQNFTWDFGDGFSSNSISDSHSFIESGTFNVTMFYNDGLGCNSWEQKDVIVKPINADFSLLNTLCGANSLMELKNISTYNIDSLSEWTTPFGSFTSDSLTYTVPVPGSYPIKLSVYDGTGCKDTISKTIIEFPIPTAAIQLSDSVVCIGDTAQLSTLYNLNYSYNWYPAGIMSNSNIYNPIAKPITNDYISLKVIDNTSTCSETDSVFVYLQDIPDIVVSYLFFRNDSTYQLTGDIIRIPISDTIQLLLSSSQKNVNYVWEENSELSCTTCPDPITNPSESVYFTISALDSSSCNYKDASKTIYLDIIPPEIKMPTAFSPNGTGDIRNEEYKVLGPGIKELIEFKIYNRWGQLIFSTTDIDKGWDGIYNGKKQNIDTYVYYVKVMTVKNEIQEKKGAFSLLR